MNYHGIRTTAIVVLSPRDTIVKCHCGHFCQLEPGTGFACCVCLRLSKACRICEAEDAMENGALTLRAYMEPISAARE